MQTAANNVASAHQKPAIVFDFGGVLLDWNPRHLYRKVFQGDEEAVERFLTEISFFEWNILQDAGRPFDEAIAELCARHPQYCDLIQIYDTRYPEAINGPIQGTVEILRELSGEGYTLYGLSNWAASKFVQVRGSYDFFNLFQDIVISGEIRIAKPDPRIFQYLLERINRPPQECLFIDDSPVNIAAARSLGFQVILFKDPVQLRCELSGLKLLSHA
jgi:2-haloacid dehalogenase